MSIRQLIERHYNEVNTQNYDDVREVFADDIVTEAPGAEPMHGVEAFVAYGQGFHRGFPDGRIHLDRYVESGDVGVVEGRFTGTNTGALDTPGGAVPATGKSLELKFADVFRIRGGRIAEHRIYYDSMALLGQLGLLPEPSQP
jgi:steroid delta-isomerase-like uncharacterized protein